MSISLGGYPLLLEDVQEEVYSWVEKNINPQEYLPWLRRSFPGFGYAGLTWPTGYRPERHFKINRFYWPLGACRWAYGHFLADAEYTDKIRNLAFTDPENTNQDAAGAGPPQAIQFFMDSPGSEAAEYLKTDVYLLPPTPLSSLPTFGDGTVNNLFLLTFVDERYYWWYKATPLLEFNDSTTWTAAFAKAQTALGKTITVDTISADYIGASPQLNMSYEVLPPWLDALAYNVGHRLIRLYDGTVKTQSYAKAVVSRTADIQGNPKRNQSAGGIRFQDIIY